MQSQKPGLSQSLTNHNFLFLKEPSTYFAKYIKESSVNIHQFVWGGCSFRLHFRCKSKTWISQIQISSTRHNSHCFSAGCIVVMNEVFIRTTEYADENLPARIPKKAEHEYGYSFVLSWIVFVFYLCAGLVFLFTSQKRKTKMADSDDELAVEDEPVRLRRQLTYYVGL